MGKKTYRRTCSVCGKRRDPITDKCPTPDECARLRAPLRRLKSEQTDAQRRLDAARIEHESLGTRSGRHAPPLPGEEERRAIAQRRARIGWRTRRSSSSSGTRA